MVKRKRTQEVQPSAEKVRTQLCAAIVLANSPQRRQISPDADEDEEAYISDDGMRFGDEVDGEEGSGQEDESDEEMGGSGDEEEEEQWEGLNGAGGADGAADEGKHTGTKPKKPPTGEELRNIKDATDLYRSSSFKLQVCHCLPPEKVMGKRSIA